MIFEEEKNNLSSDSDLEDSAQANPENSAESDHEESVEVAPEDSEQATPEESSEADQEESVEVAPEDSEQATPEESSETDPEDCRDYSQVSIFGVKLGMSRIFLGDGDSDCPVTVIEAGPCYVTQLKKINTDGYNSVQISYGDMKLKKTTKSIKGHYKKADLDPMRFLREFRVDNIEEFSIGDRITASCFSEGDLVKVNGRSIGRGFAGHMKRHGFGGGRASHGKNSVMRKAGSIGAGSDPSRVWKGTRMAGRMGFDSISVKNLSVVKVDSEKNLIYVKGSVPGSNKGLVFITK